MNKKGTEYRERRRMLHEITGDFWKCPNSGRILEGMKGDDKVMCGCARQNPKLPIPHHGGTYEHGHENGGPICHIKKFLDPSTVDDFLTQEDRDQARKDREKARLN